MGLNKTAVQEESDSMDDPSIVVEAVTDVKPTETAAAAESKEGESQAALDLAAIKAATVDQLIELKKRCGFMTAYFTEIVGAAATGLQGLFVAVTGYMNLILIVIQIIPHTKGYLSAEFIFLYPLNASGEKNFFSATDYLLRTNGIDILEYGRKRHRYGFR